MQTTETLSLPAAAVPFSEMATIDANMTCRQIAVLLMVAAHPGNSVKQLAAALDLAKPVVTRANDKLVELGLITRTMNMTDRREVELNITKAGRQRLQKAGLWLV
jgi:DNA-binding MarR family transcriptional regulator